MNTTIFKTSLDRELKARSEDILQQMGLDLSSAFKMFLAQVVMREALPFEVKIVQSNDATQRAIRDSYTGDGVARFDSVDAMLADARREG